MEPQSADLNPLEHLSDQVQPCEVHQEGAAYKSSADMLSCQYGPECFQHLAESGSWRIKATLEAREGPTRQQQGVPNKVVFINVLLALRHRYIYTQHILKLEAGTSETFVISLFGSMYNVRFLEQQDQPQTSSGSAHTSDLIIDMHVLLSSVQGTPVTSPSQLKIKRCMSMFPSPLETLLFGGSHTFRAAMQTFFIEDEKCVLSFT